MKTELADYLTKYTHQSVSDLTALWGISTDTGRSENDINQLLQKFGLNQIKTHQLNGWQILLRQFKSPFIYLLIFASLLTLVLREYTDGLIILLFIVINSSLGFYQEYKTEQIMKLLQHYTAPFVIVLRDKVWKKIISRNLVPGDIVSVKAGDTIPADMRLILAQNLSVDESVLTGESVPVVKHNQKLDLPTVQLHQAANLVFAATNVVSGEGQGIIVSTGNNTVMGSISRLTTETTRVSSFEKGMSKFSQFILYLVVITLLILIGVNYFLKSGKLDLVELIIFSIALAVSVVPEALPTVITFSLSRGAAYLAKNKVAVKRLSAIEDLGSIEVLCCDKTGTLTENILSVDQLWGKNQDQLKLFAALAGDDVLRNTSLIEAFDRAVWHSLTNLQRLHLSDFRKLHYLPFDPMRRRSSVLVQNKQDRYLIVRGAAEGILSSCRMDREDTKQAWSWIKLQGTIGKRTLAVAYKIWPKKNTLTYTSDDETSDLNFLGLISFVDPIKITTKEAIVKAQKLGVRIKILTGDSPEVAGAVAYQVGLVKSVQDMILGDKFESLSEAQQKIAVESQNVFARVSPQQKYQIIKLLEQKHEVGFLGEGINDAPALKIANVALVVSHASDIAREAADIVLLKKSLKVIIDGIATGRSVFANTTKYIKATLTSNFGNFYAVAVASLFINYLPMLPVQLLLLNLLSDFPMIMVAADNVDASELRLPKTYQIKDIAIVSTILGIVSSIFDFIVFKIYVPFGAEILHTNWFIASAITELVLLFSIRTHKLFLFAKKPAIGLIILSFLAIMATLIIPFSDFGQQFFKFVMPNLQHLLQLALIICLYFITTEVAKLWFYHFNRSEMVKVKKSI